jgi:hypothetical protein
MTRPGEQHHRTSSMTAKRAKAALSMLLAGCTAERLAGFTAAGLSSSYNVSIAEAEKMLAATRQGRLV